MSYQEQTTKDQTVTPVIDEKLATHSLHDAIAADPSLSTFLDLLTAAGLDPVLRGPDLLTVLAPSNEAFVILGKEPVDVADSHLLPGAFTADEFRTTLSVKTLRGKPLPVNVSGENITIGGARLVRTDIECTNGVIHVIDRVIRPH